MSEQHSKMEPSTSPAARRLYDSLAKLAEAWSGVEREFDAMTQQKDGAGTVDADFITITANYKFVSDADGSPSTADARSGYNELNSMIGNCGATVKQCCARFR